MSVAGHVSIKRKGVRLHQHITSHVRTLIQEGRLQPGDALPSERELSRQFEVSHLSVRKGLATLVDEGMIERHIGRGTFVAEQSGKSVGGAQRHRTIALAVDQSLRNLPFVGYGVNGVREVMPQSTFGVEVLTFGPSGCDDEMVALLQERSIAGLLYLGYLTESEATRLRQADIPVVRIGGDLDEIDVSCIWFDSDDVFQQIIAEAYRFGHRQIALATWGSGSGFSPGYVTACRRYNLLDSARRIVEFPGIAEPDPIYVTTDCLFDLDPMPTCIVVNDEIMALAVMRDLEANSLSVPDDISVVSMLDHLPQAHRVPLSAPDSNTDLNALYSDAARLLLDQMETRKPRNPRKIAKLVPCKVHFKASLGPAPGWHVPPNISQGNNGS